MTAADKKFVELLVSQRVKMNVGACVEWRVCRTFGELRHEKHLLEKVRLAWLVWKATHMKMRPATPCHECSRQKVL